MIDMKSPQELLSMQTGDHLRILRPKRRGFIDKFICCERLGNFMTHLVAVNVPAFSRGV